MSTHNICFRREIRKIICGYPLLSVAMVKVCLSEFFKDILANLQTGTIRTAFFCKIDNHINPKYTNKLAQEDNVEPGQTPQNVASEQVLHCLALI